MAIANTTPQQRLNAANACAKAEALIRDNIQRDPPNYTADLDAAVAAAISALTIVQNATV